MSDLGNKKIFSKNLKFYMKENNIDRTVLSEKLNIAYTTVNDWYNGVTYPRIDKIELVANLFNIKKSDLIEDKTRFDPCDQEEKTLENKKNKELIKLIKSLNDKEKDILINVAKWLKDNSSK